MRKIFLGTIITIVFLFIVFLATGINRKFQNQKNDYEKIANLPSFSFLTLSNERFISSKIKKGPVLVIYFHPECEHCQWEMTEIFKSNIPESFSQILLISSAHPDSIKKFLSRFNLSSYSSMITLLDSSYDFEEIFGSSIVPSFYIYDKKLHLLKAFHGEVKTETILKLISNE